ncbi:MAG: PAS domain-containing protein [Alphaproteobacteria bacterium]|nr:MAG: PAS domain-containing protein [Alphaproteobacteria bacterium]
MTINEKPLHNVKSELLRQAHTLWEKKRAGREMPSRADFDPLEMPHLLPQILMMDVEHEGPRFRVRLAGTRIVEMYGSDYTGKYLDKIEFGDMAEKVLSDYKFALTERRPVFTDHMFRQANDYRQRIERVILPLSSDGETVNILFAVLDFERI